MKISAFDIQEIFITPEQNKMTKCEAGRSSSGSSDFLGASKTKRGTFSEHDTDEGNEESNKIIQNQDCKIREFEKEQQNHLELVSKYQSLRDENEKLNEVLKEKEIDIRKQVGQGHFFTFENGILNRLIEVLKDKIYVLQTELDQLAFKKMKEVDLCKQLFLEVRKLNLMICQLKEEITTYKKENEELKALVQEKKPNNERLSNELENLSAKDQREILEISKISSPLDNITIKTKDLRHILSQKDQELSLLQIRDELGEISKATSELQAKLVLIPDGNLRIHTEMFHLNRMLENKTKEMEVKISQLMREKETLIEILKSTKEEMEALMKEKNRKMNEHIQEINNIKVRDQNLVDEISKFVSKIEEMQKLFGVVQNKGNLEEKDQLKGFIQKANRELEEVLVRVRSKTQEVAGLQHKLAEAMEQIEEDKMRIQKMKEEMNSLEASLESVKNENIKLRGGIKSFISIFA